MSDKGWCIPAILGTILTCIFIFIQAYTSVGGLIGAISFSTCNLLCMICTYYIQAHILDCHIIVWISLIYLIISLFFMIGNLFYKIEPETE